MFKLIFAGGLVALLGLSGLSLANLVMGTIGLGVALFVLAVVLELVAGLIEATRTSARVEYSSPTRLKRDGPSA